MIVSVAGLSLTLGDLSYYVDRQQQFSIEATLGNRMDLLNMTLMDTIPPTLAIPDRAEIIVYDAAAGSAVTDPPTGISAYNTWKNGTGHEVTSSTPSAWTQRLYAGYAGKVVYSGDGGPQRWVQVAAQDYTYRLRTTACNMAFVAGQSDKSIIQQLFVRYRGDIDTSAVTVVTAVYPAISFPVHTLEQFLQRLVRISRAFYRVDYYKRLQYGVVGLLTAPLNWSDNPDFTVTFPTEGLTYEPDGTGLVNKVWVVGGSFLSGQQAYQIPTSAIQNSAYQFALPGNPEPGGMSVTIGGVNQGQGGVAPADGDLTNPSGFRYAWIVQHTPAVIAFKTLPATGATIIVTGKFRYPLVQVVSDPTLIAATGGLIFEAVVRDKRIADMTLAQQVGQNYLKQQGKTIKGGTFLTKYYKSPITGQVVQPGQQFTIANRTIYAGVIPSGYAANVLADSPVGYWRLQDAGTTAADAGSGAHNGTLNGGITKGAPGPPLVGDVAMAFDGSSGYISIAPLGTMNHWTLEAWFQSSGPQSSSAAIVTDAYTGTNVNYAIVANPDVLGSNPHQLSAGFYDSGGWHLAPAYTFTDGAWVRATATYDGATICLYINGFLFSQLAYAATPISDGSGFRIGRRWDSGNYFYGSIAEVAAYNFALGPARVLAHSQLVNSVLAIKTSMKLSEDANQPWELQVDYADRSVGGGL